VNRIKTHGAEVLLKLESFNPLSSVKDRAALFMVEDARKKGLIRPGSTIVEATSGNTGIALAFIAAVYGYRLIIVMPDTMSVERRGLLKAFGAEIILTPGKSGLKGAVKKAQEILRKMPRAFMPEQFANPANARAHRETTDKELIRDTGGKIDFFVTGVGTGGTLTGAGFTLKRRINNIQIIAVEPRCSAVLSGRKPGPHKIQGIGAGFIPQALDRSLIDEVVRVGYDDAKGAVKELARKEGILTGVSGGAAFFAGLKIAKRSKAPERRIVVLLPDTGERYLSTGLFD
jgi:cysteine synthase A